MLEYLTGWILEQVFHNKWWDYSEFPFNIRGYVCLKFSVLWGLACSFIMLVLHPMIYKFIQVIPKTIGVIFLAAVLPAFAVDCIFTVSTILKLNRRLKVIDEVAGMLHEISDEIGENIYENVAEAMEKKEIADKKRAEYEKLAKRHRELLEDRIFGHERLLKAFPGMKSTNYNDSLQKLRLHLRELIKKGKEKEEADR